MINWAFIRDLCAEAGVENELEQFEVYLPNLFTTALLQATGSEQRYLSDPAHRGRVNTIVAIIVSALLQPERKAERHVNMDRLTEVFADEVERMRE